MATQQPPDFHAPGQRSARRVYGGALEGVNGFRQGENAPDPTITAVTRRSLVETSNGAELLGAIAKGEGGKSAAIEAAFALTW